MNRFKSILAFIFTGLALSVLSFAQTGSIQGTVTDKTGAVVQGADVTITNLDTNQARSTKSGASGSYSVPSLPPGNYGIAITKEGFRAFKVEKANLTVDQVLTVNPQLEPGATSEEVQVQGNEIPPVDLETAQVSNVVESKQIQELPLITRDPYSLVLLSPGTSQSNTGLGGFTVNGARERNNNFMLDGVDNNDTSVPGIPDGLLTANPDSTEEFRVITNNFNAEYGRNTGAIIDVATKSGTNSLHGDVYEFGRWNSFGGARDWFNPRVSPDGTTINPMNPYVRNQFGFSVGGPIIKNKTFFFVNDEFDRFRTTLTNSAVVPTAAFRTGVFTYKGVNLDLTQQASCPQSNNNAFCLPLDPTVQKIFSFYPLPASSSDGLSGVAFFPSSSKTDAYNPVVKIDHQFTGTESLSMRYEYNHSFDPNPFHADTLPGGIGAISSKAIVQGAKANLTSTLKPTLVNNFVFGWNRLYDFFGCGGLSQINSVFPVDQFGNGTDFFFDAPFTNFGCTGLVADDQWRKTGTTSFSDNLSWVRGNHVFKFGGDFRNVGEQGPNNFFSRRELTLSTFITQTGFGLLQNVPAAVDTLSLENSAIALYGFVGNDFAGEFFNKAGTRQATDNKFFRQHEYDWFGQDTWKVRRNLTLTLGLRYQLDGVPYEENANFSNLLANPGSFQAGQTLTMSVVGPGTGNSLYKQDYSNIEPRLGFSWDPWGDGKTAVRGAFGIFHDRVFGNLFGNARGNPPFEQDYNNFVFDTFGGSFGPNAFFPGSGFLPAAVPTTSPSPDIPDGSHLAPILFDTHFKNTVSNNWNLGIQRELPGNNVVDLAYVASEAHHLPRQIDGNAPDPALVNSLVAYCSNPSNAFGCVPDEVTGILLYEGADVFGLLPQNAVANNALVQPFYQVSVGNSVYNSLQAKITHRTSHGLLLQGSYTWAHAIDDAPDPLAPAAGNRTFPRNSRNLGEERGNSDYDVRHRFVANYIYELPFGKGKNALSHGFVGKVFEGWQLAGIATVQTGHPFDIFTTTDMERSGLSGRADRVPGQDPYSKTATGSINQGDVPGEKIWFYNAGAFSDRCFNSAAGNQCPFYTGPGSVGRNNFYGPHLVNFDAVWSKNTKIGERVNTELRVECYNLFNHPHFLNPANQWDNPATFGLITGTLTQPDGTTSARQIQVALKIAF